MTVKDNLVAFRVALCFLAIACARTEQGSVLFKVRVDGSELVFECQDSAGLISTHDKEHLFGTAPSHGMEDMKLSGLSCATSLLESIGSNFGYEANATFDLYRLICYSMALSQKKRIHRQW